ncbi:MAG TPA: ANTAR domain-containing protein [Candidatus Binatia bacterium]|jgi:response regulator NasT
MKKVLILDDRLLARGDLSKRLTELGFVMVRDGASDGLAERVERASADIVLMRGSVFAGSAAAEEISAIAPKPIVLLQEANGRNNGETATGGGYVLIPFAAPEVAAALELAATGFAELRALKKENDELRKTLEARKVIERAKGVLMKNRGLSEAEAFSLIQKKSMDLRKPMVDIAQAIVLSEEVTGQKVG